VSTEQMTGFLFKAIHQNKSNAFPESFSLRSRYLIPIPVSGTGYIGTALTKVTFVALKKVSLD
jgi:hypothetical protein